MQSLKKQFEIPGAVAIEIGRGGLVKIVVTTPQAMAEIYLQGAHVTNYQPMGKQPVLFMSNESWFEPGKPIRGGVPICFPWFGPNQENPQLPAHGFARLREWGIDSITQAPNGEVRLVLTLHSDDRTRALWPFDFTATHVITIGSTLEMTLGIENRSGKNMRFEEALHTYLNVSDIKQVRIEGLQGAEYLDKVDGAKSKTQSDREIQFTGETDRPYLGTQTACIVRDPKMNRNIEISKRESNTTVVWNPWINKAKAMPDFGDDEWLRMVCVETANVGKHAVELPQGSSHEMTAILRVI